MAIKLYFVPESGEKPQSLWHTLKIHPYGPEAEAQRLEKRPIVSQNYEEVIFNEPVEQFYEILTGGPALGGKSKSGKGAKQSTSSRQETHTAEVPSRETRENPYSKDTEGKELDRMKEALRKVDEMIVVERDNLSDKEQTLEKLKKAEGVVPKKK